LDEIGELPLEVQAALLGVLERKRFKRLGGQEEIPADVRVVAATHRDLRAAVNAGKFREDLFYRLGVVVLRIPPLRERTEDIRVLIDHFLVDSGHTGRASEILDSKTMALLEQHHWPGNVRELRNFVAAALAMGEPPELAKARAELPATLLAREVVAGLLSLSYAEAKGRVLDEFEQLYLKGLLARCKNNVSKAAREAQMDRSHLRNLIAKHLEE
jgi:DNA-binding NtrC family response regulator